MHKNAVLILKKKQTRITLNTKKIFSHAFEIRIEWNMPIFTSEMEAKTTKFL